MEKEINIKDIKQEITVPAILVEKRSTAKYLIKYKDILLNIKKIKPVIQKTKEKNLILLEPSKKLEISKIALEPTLTLQTHKITKTASDFTYQELLTNYLEKSKIPSSFETIGKIAIINLRHKSQLLHKKKIGEAILITHKHLNAIFNKTEKLDNKFRTPKLEHLAGSKNTLTTVIEQKIKIKLDVTQVYFCSRLHHERERVTNYLKKYDVVADVFCGVGAFSLIAAKKFKCKVFANDLNPFCYKFLEENVRLNGLKGFESFCEDGREFVFRIFRMFAKREVLRVDHFYMNLPALAIEFLDVFLKTPVGLLEKGFFIHVYCFQGKEREEGEEVFVGKIKERIRKRLGKVFCWAEFREFHFLKQVSSAKVMMCVSIWMEKKKVVKEEVQLNLKKLKKE